jgi:hypothetical protein
MKLFSENFILQALFQSAQQICEKRAGSGSVPLTNGPGSGRPKRSQTLVLIVAVVIFMLICVLLFVQSPFCVCCSGT